MVAEVCSVTLTGSIFYELISSFAFFLVPINFLLIKRNIDVIFHSFIRIIYVDSLISLVLMPDRKKVKKVCFIVVNNCFETDIHWSMLHRVLIITIEDQLFKVDPSQEYHERIDQDGSRSTDEGLMG